MKKNTKNQLLLLFICFTNIIIAQNFSNLENKVLNKLNDTSIDLLNLGAKKLNGSINNITVTYDSEKKLKVTINYTGLETAHFECKILDAAKKTIADIPTIKFSLEGKSSPLELEFLLSDNVAEGTEITSPFLLINLKKSKNDFLPKATLYNLNKNWKSEINPENLIIPVKLEPIGSAASLNNNIQTIILPQKKPEIKSYLNKSKFYSLSKSSTKPLVSKTYKHDDAILKKAIPKKITTDKTKKTLDGTWLNNNKTYEKITKFIISEKDKKIEIFETRNNKDFSLGKSKLINKSKNRYIAKFRIASTSTIYTTLSFTAIAKEKLKVVISQRTKKIKFKKHTVIYNKQILFIPYIPVYTVPLITTTTDSEEEVSLETLGPDNKPISLWEDLVADVDFEFPYEIANVRMDIYPDKNLASGTFYYLPSAYHLRWNADEGYQFRMLHGFDDGTENLKNVRMTGTLTPNISSKEIALIKSLLQSYVQDNAIYSYTELKIMPLKSIPKISLASDLEGQYNLSESDINISVTSTINNPIDVSWMTSSNTNQEMQVALSEGVGIKGTMVLEPDSETIPEQLIPVRITISDTRTIGKLILQPNNWRDSNWKNETPFPIKIKYIHALIIEKKNNKTIPLIYTWGLNDVVVPPLSQIDFDDSKMPTWIDTKEETKQIWIEYSIEECTTCVNKIMAEVRGGTVKKTKEISFEAFQVFEKTDAAFLKIEVRSIQADPKGETIVALESIRITEDMNNTNIGPFFIPEEETLQYEYYYTLVMKDGIKYESDNWQNSTEEEIYVGLHSLKEAISNLPGF